MWTWAISFFKYCIFGFSDDFKTNFRESLSPEFVQAQSTKQMQVKQATNKRKAQNMSEQSKGIASAMQALAKRVSHTRKEQVRKEKETQARI